MEQHNPPHPGEVLWELDMEPLGLTVKEVAERLHVDRKTLSRVIHGHSKVTVDMAIRLSRAFKTSPDLWLTMQKNYDLWCAQQNISEEISNIKPFAA